jgi:hypothetical protein
MGALVREKKHWANRELVAQIRAFNPVGFSYSKIDSLSQQLAPLKV